MNRRPVVLLLLLLTLPLFEVFAQTGLDALQNYRRGRDLEAMNRMQDADTYYNEAVRLCTDEISRNNATRDSYAVLTWTLQRQKKYADVITWGERGLRIFSDEFRIVETMGEAYFYMDNYAASQRSMQRYVNSNPRGDRVSVAYFFLGEIFRIEGKFRHADMAYTTAVLLEPSLSLWWYRLGLVREAAGDFKPAAEAFEQAVRINPNYREAADGLARSRRQAG